MDWSSADSSAAGQRVQHRADGGGARQPAVRQVPEWTNRRQVRVEGKDGWMEGSEEEMAAV